MGFGCAWLRGSVVLACALFASSPAPAAAQVAGPRCPETRNVEELAFSHRDMLFRAIDLDSGWVPAGSPLQVRFGVRVAGESEVELNGALVSEWPIPVMTSVVGTPGGGRFGIEYGIEIIAQIRFDVTVAGIRYSWSGDIPILPAALRDLMARDEATFDPWVLPDADPRPISLYDETSSIRVLNVGLGSFIPIPGVDGGFEVRAALALGATYQTQHILVTPGDDVITEELQIFRMLSPEGGYGRGMDVTVLPEGELRWRGGVVLRPGLYVEVVGTRFDLPIAEIPLNLLDLMGTTRFEPAEVYVPFGDLRVEPGMRVDFGVVPAGEEQTRMVTLHNDGDAVLEIEVQAPGPPFHVESGRHTLPPSSRVSLPIRFAPVDGGARSAMLLVRSSDPDACVTTILLDGEGVGMLPVDAGTEDAGPADAGVGAPSLPGGCGCRATSGPAALWLPALLLFAIRRRR
ncbi:MAG: hypothetical protein KF901_14625 [Myxococcales bacterium]|nr:hypothetical protein [Myxococcales bacterium]